MLISFIYLLRVCIWMLIFVVPQQKWREKERTQRPEKIDIYLFSRTRKRRKSAAKKEYPALVPAMAWQVEQVEINRMSSETTTNEECNFWNVSQMLFANTMQRTQRLRKRGTMGVLNRNVTPKNDTAHSKPTTTMTATSIQCAAPAKTNNKKKAKTEYAPAVRI